MAFHGVLLTSADSGVQAFFDFFRADGDSREVMQLRRQAIENGHDTPTHSGEALPLRTALTANKGARSPLTATQQLNSLPSNHASVMSVVGAHAGLNRLFRKQTKEPLVAPVEDKSASRVKIIATGVPDPDMMSNYVASGALVRPSLSTSLCFPFNAQSHDYVFQNREFMPHPSTAIRGACDDPKGTEIRRHLELLSSPPTCEAKRQASVDTNPFAFGSMVSSWIKVRSPGICLLASSRDFISIEWLTHNRFLTPQPFMYAVDQNMSFWSPLLSTNFKDQTGTRCKFASTNCFFKPLSKCEWATSMPGCGKSVARIDQFVPGDSLRRCVQYVKHSPPEIVLDVYSPYHRSISTRDFSDIDENGNPAYVRKEYRKMGYFW